MNLDFLNNLVDFSAFQQLVIGGFAAFLIVTGIIAMVSGDLGPSVWRAFGVGRGGRPVDGSLVLVLGFVQGVLGCWLLSAYVTMPSLKFW